MSRPVQLVAAVAAVGLGLASVRATVGGPGFVIAATRWIPEELTGRWTGAVDGTVAAVVARATVEVPGLLTASGLLTGFGLRPRVSALGVVWWGVINGETSGAAVAGVKFAMRETCPGRDAASGSGCGVRRTAAVVRGDGGDAVAGELETEAARCTFAEPTRAGDTAERARPGFVAGGSGAGVGCRGSIVAALTGVGVAERVTVGSVRRPAARATTADAGAVGMTGARTDVSSGGATVR